MNALLIVLLVALVFAAYWAGHRIGRLEGPAREVPAARNGEPTPVRSHRL